MFDVSAGMALNNGARVMSDVILDVMCETAKGLGELELELGKDLALYGNALVHIKVKDDGSLGIERVPPDSQSKGI